MKGSRVESIEDARKEYKELLEEGWEKTNIFKSYLQKQKKIKLTNEKPFQKFPLLKGLLN